MGFRHAQAAAGDLMHRMDRVPPHERVGDRSEVQSRQFSDGGEPGSRIGDESS